MIPHIANANGNGTTLLTPGARRGAAFVALVGLAVVIAYVFVWPARAWTGVLSAAIPLLTISLGALVLVACAWVTHAGWTAVVRRTAEGLGAALPVGAIAIVAIAAFGLRFAWPWAGTLDPAGEAAHIVHARGAWQTPVAFIARMVGLLALWLVLAALMRRSSRRLDAESDDEGREHRRSRALAAMLIVAVAVGFSLGAFDWMMSTEPTWASTIYGLYQLGGLLVAGTAGVTLVAILLRRRGALSALREDHLHDLGKLLFGFSTLWAYLWLSQYLLVWYANIPEETAHYASRSTGGWSFLFWLNPIAGWLLPFITLLPRPAKRSEANLLRVCVMLLAARWLDVYLGIAPGVAPTHAGIGAPELAAVVGLGAVFLLVIDRALARGPLVAPGDPYLVESLHHRT